MEMIDTAAAEETLAARLEVLAYLTLLSIGVLWIAWRLGFFQIDKDQSRESNPLSFKNVLQIYSIFILIQMMLVPLLMLGWAIWEKGRKLDLHSFKLDASAMGWINLFGLGLSAFFIMLYYFLSKKTVQRAAWGENSFHGFRLGLKNFLFGAAAWLVCFPIVAWLGQSINILLPLFYKGPHIDQVAVKHLKSTFSDPVLFWGTVVAIVCVVPVLEELLFRGFFQTWLKRHFGRLKAILGSALLFAAFHFSIMQGMNNIELMVALFVLGSFLGFIFERQGSLWAPIGLHATFNAISIMMIFKTNQ